MFPFDDVIMASAAILVPSDVVKSLQIILRSDIPKWNLWIGWQDSSTSNGHHGDIPVPTLLAAVIYIYVYIYVYIHV